MKGMWTSDKWRVEGVVGKKLAPEGEKVSPSNSTRSKGDSGFRLPFLGYYLVIPAYAPSMYVFSPLEGLKVKMVVFISSPLLFLIRYIKNKLAPIKQASLCPDFDQERAVLSLKGLKQHRTVLLIVRMFRGCKISTETWIGFQLSNSVATLPFKTSRECATKMDITLVNSD